jgi:predicted ATP-grasp superfamily ATP-dependent carboligase
VKEPATLKAALDSLEIPSPAIRLGVPASKDGWLVKRRGGSGGGHIRPWDGKPPDNSRGAVYFQERVAGIPISALFIGAEGRAILVGFSRQWESASPAYPFRFGGACHLGKEELCPRLLRDMIRRTAPLFQAFPMTGLVSLDFLVDGARWNLLEINPRPGATLDIFDIEGTNLFEHHVKAASGILPETPFHFVKAAAAEIVYADEGALELKPEVTLPDWIKDQPDPDASIERNDPICTVFAMAGDANAALNLCKERVRYARNFFRKASFMGECRDDGRWQSFQSS